VEEVTYDLMAELQDKYWWFVARRKIIKKLISTMNLPKNAKILEVGCGAGGNLLMLSQFGDVFATDFNQKAVDYSRALNIAKEVEQGKLPEDVAFPSEKFDLIVAFDVIEHIEEEQETLTVLRNQLKEGGRLFLTVPAYQFLWSKYDEMVHHKRRYTKTSLLEVLNNTKFKTTYISYFNFFLSPLVAFTKILQKILPQNRDRLASELRLTDSIINTILKKIFSIELLFIGRHTLPFGVSIAVIAQSTE